MSKSAFKLRSGNTTPFKQMGSSPLKQDTKMHTGTTIFGKTIPEIKDFAKKVFKGSGTGRLYEKAKNMLNKGIKESTSESATQIAQNYTDRLMQKKGMMKKEFKKLKPTNQETYNFTQITDDKGNVVK